MDSKGGKCSLEVESSQFCEEMAGDTNTEEVVQRLLSRLLGETWIKDEVVLADTDEVVLADTDEVVLADTNEVVLADTDESSQFCEEMVGDTNIEEVVQGLLTRLLGETWIKDEVVLADTDEVVLADTNDVVLADTDEVVLADTNEVVLIDTDDTDTDTDEVVLGGTDKMVLGDIDEVALIELDEVAIDDEERVSDTGAELELG